MISSSYIELVAQSHQLDVLWESLFLAISTKSKKKDGSVWGMS